MTRVVFDTNVYISALFWKGIPFKLLHKLLEGEIENYISLPILEEISSKLSLKFSIPPRKRREFLETIVLYSSIVYPRKRIRVVARDPSDNKIVECAQEAKASFIITGDKHLLVLKSYQDIQIVSPREFLRRL